MNLPDIGMLRLPQTIEWGRGARANIPRVVMQHGRRVFIVVDPFLATTSDFQDVLATLTSRGVTAMVHTDVLPELPVESLAVSADVARAFRPEVILGYGGGSALDASKLIALLLAHGGVLSNYYGENAVPGGGAATGRCSDHGWYGF